MRKLLCVLLLGIVFAVTENIGVAGDVTFYHESIGNFTVNAEFIIGEVKLKEYWRNMYMVLHEKELLEKQ
jgi:hypothetical protein